MSAAAIEVRDLRHRYGRTVALDGVTLDVERGALFALLGPNGAGKSTLIDILCTIRPPDEGAVSIAGVDARRRPLQARRRIGVVFQDTTLDTRLSVEENLAFHGMIYQMSPADRRRQTDEMLALVELDEWRDAPARTLSTGMKRRLEIARALMHEPDVLFLDEPTVGLDAQSRARIWEHVARLRARRELTVVVTTHYIDEVEGADTVCVIDRGRILAEGAPAELKAEHGSALVRATPATPAAAAAIRKAHPDLAQGADGQLLIRMAGQGEVDRLLAEFGDALRQVTVEKASLESVFLGLTGRDLRESPPAGPKGGRNGKPPRR